MERIEQGEGSRTGRGGVVAVLLWLGVLAGLGAFADGWRADNRIDRWARQLTPSPGYEILRDHFSGDEAVLVRLDRFDPENGTQLDSARALAAALHELPAVERCVDPFELVGGDPWSRNDAQGESVPVSVGRRVIEANQLIGNAPAFVDVVLQVDPASAPEERGRLAEALTEHEAEVAAAGLRARAAGHPLVSAALDAESRRVERRFTPLLVLVAVLGCALFLRSFPLALLALLPAGTASLGARAFGRAVLGPSDLILVAVGPIAFVVQLAASLHLLVRFQHHLAVGNDPRAAARAAIGEKREATLLAGLTTAVGFAVFRTSSLRSVANLGTLLAGVALGGCVLTLVVLPFVLARLPLSSDRAAARRPKLWRRLAAWSARRRAPILGLGAAALATACVVGPNLRTSTNGVHYFPNGHAVRQHFLELEDEGAALSSAEVLVRRGDGAAWTPDELLALDLGAPLRAVPGVGMLLGPEDVLRAAGDGIAAQLLLPEALRQSARLDTGGEWARWTLRFTTGEAEQTQALLDRVDAVLAQHTADHTAHVAGSVPRLQAVQATLVGTLVQSLAWTVLVTTLLFLMVARRPADLVSALFANVLPVSAVLVTAWAFRVPLDGATTMVAAVVLGLAVDNTFHLMHAAERATGLRARLEAFGRVGDGAAVGAAALALGFSTLALSGFAPTARFGALAAVGAATAWFGDLFLLPALWLRRRRGA